MAARPMATSLVIRHVIRHVISHVISMGNEKAGEEEELKEGEEVEVVVDVERGEGEGEEQEQAEWEESGRRPNRRSARARRRGGQGCPRGFHACLSFRACTFHGG